MKIFLLFEFPLIASWDKCYWMALWQTRLGLDIFASGQLKCQSPNKRTLKSLIKCGAPISPFVLEIILDLYETSNCPCLLV